MSGDTYQAVYDAVSSRIARCNPGSILEEAARNAFDISHARAILQQDVAIAIAEVAAAMTRPSVIFRPTLAQRPAARPATRWAAVYGQVIGHGASPNEAMLSFDAEWARTAT